MGSFPLLRCKRRSSLSPHAPSICSFHLSVQVLGQMDLYVLWNALHGAKSSPLALMHLW